MYFFFFFTLASNLFCIKLICIHAQLHRFTIPCPVARQAPLTMGFSRQEYWSRLHFSSRGSSQPRDWTCVSCIHREILYHCTTWETRQSLNAIKYPVIVEISDCWHQEVRRTQTLWVVDMSHASEGPHRWPTTSAQNNPRSDSQFLLPTVRAGMPRNPSPPKDCLSTSDRDWIE